MPVGLDYGSAAVAALETFWLSAGVLGTVLLLFYLLLPVRSATTVPAGAQA